MDRKFHIVHGLLWAGVMAGCGVGQPHATSVQNAKISHPIAQAELTKEARPVLGELISRTPRVPGAMALPKLEALVANAPGVVPTTLGILSVFPTLGFGGSRWIDLYQPFFAGSSRALAFEGLPFGIDPGIFNRMHFLGVNSHFGMYLPYFAGIGGMQPFYLKAPDAPFYYYPLFLNRGNVMTPVTYTTKELLLPYGANGVCPGVTPGVLSQLGWIGARPGVTSHLLVP
ncbi:MAG: hypothetical protein VKO21_05635 [Candidatus Sericytochromatia bacterium]|nr:hypothetical protein [Candidatus Sericytochromatia bacterium]